MHLNALIDAVVRQTTILIAHLATAAGVRAPLAHVANQVFLELVGELREQGVGGKVIADMFGMALRTYHARVRRLSESATDRGRTLWEAVLAFTQEKGPARRADILHRFRYDDEATVRGVLNDLVESGMVFKSGRGDSTTYIAAPDGSVTDQDPVEGDAVLVLVGINRYQPISRDDLAAAIKIDGDALDLALKRLEADGRARQAEGAWRCDECVIPYGTTTGWEAAIFDHYQALVTALCTKLRTGATQARRSDAIGGSTYGFDVWPGHPLEDEVMSLLADTRARVSEVRARVEAYNTQNQAPPKGSARIIYYVGQTIIEDEETK